MTALAWEGLGILIVLGLLFSVLVWMLADASGCFEERRDNARPYTRDT